MDKRDDDNRGPETRTGEEDPDFEAQDPGREFSERRGYTAEIGSEGGSPGDLQTTRDTPDVAGSEAEGIARKPQPTRLHDREAGGGT